MVQLTAALGSAPAEAEGVYVWRDVQPGGQPVVSAAAAAPMSVSKTYTS